MNSYFFVCQSPVGELVLTSNGSELTGLFIKGEKHCPDLKGATNNCDLPIFAQAKEQLSEYFAGERTEFDVPLRHWGTKFQTEVWTELTKIPYGETITYSQLAERVGNRRAVRAVGAANGKNPISIFVPCHRVIGSDGSLVGYGGGLRNKKFLLQHESLT